MTVKLTTYQYDSNLNFLNQNNLTFDTQVDADSYQLAEGESKLSYVPVYMADTNNIFTGSKLVRSDYKLASHETLTKPEDGLYDPIILDTTNNIWVGTSQADWQAKRDAELAAYYTAHPEDKPQPSATETALAALSYQQMQNQQTISDLQTANAQLAYQVMTTNGGTN